MNPLEALHAQFLDEQRKLALTEQPESSSTITSRTPATTAAIDPHAAYEKRFREREEREFREWQEIQNRPLKRKQEQERERLLTEEALAHPAESTPAEMRVTTEPTPEPPPPKERPQQSRQRSDGGDRLTAAVHRDAEYNQSAPRKIAARMRPVQHRSAPSANDDNGRKEIQSAADLLVKMTQPKARKISARKMEANRKNAQKSTGPTSVDGKRASARNATKHGFFSTVAVIKDRDGGESQEEFDQLHAKLRHELQPVGYMEDLRVERIAVNLWRKRRLLRYENGLISDRFSNRRDMIATGPERERRLGSHHLLPLSPERRLELDERTDHLCMAVQDADRMLRYESMIERQLNSDFIMLRELQLRRKSRKVHGKTNDGSNLVSSASQASEIRETENTTCADEEARRAPAISRTLAARRL